MPLLAGQEERCALLSFFRLGHAVVAFFPGTFVVVFDSSNMLAADKLQLQSQLKQQATALKEKEFNLHHSNMSKWSALW